MGRRSHTGVLDQGPISLALPRRQNPGLEREAGPWVPLPSGGRTVVRFCSPVRSPSPESGSGGGGGSMGALAVGRSDRVAVSFPVPRPSAPRGHLLAREAEA